MKKSNNTNENSNELFGYKIEIPYKIMSVASKLKDKDIIGKDMYIRTTYSDYKYQIFIPRYNLDLAANPFTVTFKTEKELGDYLKKAKIKAVIDSDLIKNIILDRFKAALSTVDVYKNYLDTDCIDKATQYLNELSGYFMPNNNDVFSTNKWNSCKDNPPKESKVYELMVQNRFTKDIKIEKCKYLAGLKVWFISLYDFKYNVIKWKEC